MGLYPHRSVAHQGTSSAVVTSSRFTSPLQPQFMYASGRTASFALVLLAAVGVDVSSTAWAGTDGTALLRHTITGRFEMLLLSRSWAGVVPCSNLVALFRHVARGPHLRRCEREFYPVVRIDTAGRKRAGL